MRNATIVSALTFCVLTSTLGCGNGGSNGTVTAEQLSGWWDVTARIGGSALYDGVEPIELQGAGSIIRGCGEQATVSGNMITSSDPDEPPLTIVNANLLTATDTIEIPGSAPQTIEVTYSRRTLPAPTGTLNLDGTLGGSTFQLNSPEPTAAVETPGGTSIVIRIRDCAPDRLETEVEITVPGSSVMTTPYMFSATPMPGDPSLYIEHADGGGELAVSGTLTFTQVGDPTIGTRFAGNFSVMLNPVAGGGGGPMTGSFDVEIFNAQSP